METAENIMRIHQTIYGKGSGCCILFTQPFTLAFQKSFINFLIQQSGWFKVAWNKNQKRNLCNNITCNYCRQYACNYAKGYPL